MKKLIFNSLSSWVLMGISILVNFIITPLIIRHIGKESFGMLNLINSVIIYCGLMDLGLSSAVFRFMAVARANKRKFNRIANTALAVFVLLGIITVFVSLYFARPLSRFFSIPPAYAGSFARAIGLFGWVAAVSFPLTIFTTIVKAHEDFVLINAIQALMLFLKLALTVILLESGTALEGIIFANLVTSVCTLLILCPLAVCKYGFRPDPKLFNLKVLRVLSVYASATAVILVADTLRFNVDNIVIGKYLALSSVAVYGIAGTLVKFFMLFMVNGIQTVFTPRFSALAKDPEKLRTLFLNSLAVSSALSFFIGAFLFLNTPEIIGMWVGDEFSGAVPVLRVLLVCYTFALAQSPAIALAYALKKHYLFALMAVLEGIINLGLSVFLVTRMGILGVALGTAIPMLAVKIFVQPWYVCRILKLDAMAFFARMIPGSCAAVSFAVLEFYLFKGLVVPAPADLILKLSFSAVPAGVIIIFFLQKKMIITRRIYEGGRIP